MGADQKQSGDCEGGIVLKISLGGIVLKLSLGFSRLEEARALAERWQEEWCVVGNCVGRGKNWVVGQVQSVSARRVSMLVLGESSLGFVVLWLVTVMQRETMWVEQRGGITLHNQLTGDTVRGAHTHTHTCSLAHKHTHTRSLFLSQILASTIYWRGENRRDV